MSNICRVAAAVVLAFAASLAYPQTDEEHLVVSSEKTLSRFESDPDVSWFRDHIGEAKALLIAPKIVKAGFVLGGSGGHAVLLHRDPAAGTWTGPAFYSLGTGSLGFQIGVEVCECVTLVMTERGFHALLSSSFKIGGDLSVAAGPIGAGARSNILADFVTFVRAKGLYGGLDLEGTVVKVDRHANVSYYGEDLDPPDILIRPRVASDKALPLVQLIERIQAAHSRDTAVRP
jgi:lipid-binding SYLF domain-containing protein